MFALVSEGVEDQRDGHSAGRLMRPGQPEGVAGDPVSFLVIDRRIEVIAFGMQVPPGASLLRSRAM